MIFIDRTKVPEPKALTNPAGAAADETQRAIQHFTSAKKDEKFEFAAYNNDEVKETLRLLFKGKCAYCESPILTITVGDIEHFRPKGAIDTDNKKKIKPGYYWLAAKWDNLLLSCNNCNRKTTQGEFEGATFTMGKANQFPVDDETLRCKEHTIQLTQEEDVRLLINPCIDNPEQFLEYLDNGAIKAKTLPDPFAVKKAESSIKVYALLRDPLVMARAELLKDIQYHIARLTKLREDIIKAKELGVQQWEDACYKDMEEVLNKLSGYIAPERPYSAIAKQFIVPILKENKLI